MLGIVEVYTMQNPHARQPDPAPCARHERPSGRGAPDRIQHRRCVARVRLALLEADVALPVVKELIAAVKEKGRRRGGDRPADPGAGAGRRGIMANLPASWRVECRAESGDAAACRDPDGRFAGAGKTTTVGKLAKLLRDTQKRRCWSSAADCLPSRGDRTVEDGGRAGWRRFLPLTTTEKPVDIARAAIDWAKRHYHDVLLIDTAGRLAVDEAMMKEIAELHAAIDPIETLFVVDAMLGQDAVNTAKAFNDALPLTGVVLTKLDGDARGGAALSVRHVTGKPLKFAGIGEKLSGLEPFHPERMASRILGMGDVLSLIEEARKGVDEEKALEFAKKLKSGKGFDLNDFRDQIGQMRKMGGMASLMDKLPAQFAQAAGQVAPGTEDKVIRRIEGIINAMTPLERSKPELIKASRKRRIATGSGVQVQGSEPPAQPVRADAEDDEAVFQGRPGQTDARHERHDARRRLHALIPLQEALARLRGVAPLVMPGGTHHVRVFRAAEAAVVAAECPVKIAFSMSR